MIAGRRARRSSPGDRRCRTCCGSIARRPGFAGAIWLSALFLRALASLAAAVAVEVYVPMTGVLEPLGAWCGPATVLERHTVDRRRVRAARRSILAGR